MTTKTAQRQPQLPIGPLGQRLDLIYVRERMGLTIRGLGRAAGVSYETVRRFEHGYIPLPHQALKIADALGVDYDQIVPRGARQIHEQRRRAAA